METSRCVVILFISYFCYRKLYLTFFFFNPCAHFQGLTKNSKIRTMISLFTQRLPCASEPSKTSSKLFQKMFSVITIKKNILLKACLFVPMSVLSPHTSSSGPSHSLCYFSLSHDWHPCSWDFEQFGILFMIVLSLAYSISHPILSIPLLPSWHLRNTAILFSSPIIHPAPPYVFFLHINPVLKIHIS